MFVLFRNFSLQKPCQARRKLNGKPWGNDLRGTRHDGMPGKRSGHAVPILTLFAFGRKMLYLCGTEMRGTAKTVLFSCKQATCKCHLHAHVEKSGLLLKKFTCHVNENGSSPRENRCHPDVRSPILFAFIKVTEVKNVNVRLSRRPPSQAFSTATDADVSARSCPPPVPGRNDKERPDFGVENTSAFR